MKLIAKKGTAFEKVVKEMFEKMTEGVIGAKDLIENKTGVRPSNFVHMFHWGTISQLVPEFEISYDDIEKINPLLLRKKKGCDTVYVPALRYKEGKELAAAFRKFAEEHKVTDEPLHEYGIHMVDWKNGISYYIHPFYDYESNRYMLDCSDGIPKAFDKAKLSKEQFDIEY